MGWPTITDYREAIQYPEICFADSQLRHGTVDTDRLGLPRAISGNFAAVFPVMCEGKKVAVRLFTSYHPDQQNRYQIIHSYLKNHQLPYMVDFAFLGQGIQLNGQWYPLLKMEWVEGEPLASYVERNHVNPPLLKTLAARFQTMMCDLQKLNIAHGDLQHGNILLVNGALKLVDYDSMFVPGLENMPSHELGHRNYQSPKRTENDFGPDLDRFSAWVIYTSLEAMSTDPTLWRRFCKDKEGLLFCRDDFVSTESSALLEALDASTDEKVRGLSWHFRSLPDTDLPLIPLLDASSISARFGGSDWDNAIGQVESFLKGRVPESVPSAAADWLADHLPSLPLVRFSAVPRNEVVIAGVFLIVLCLLPAIMVLRAEAWPRVVAGWATGTVGLLGCLLILYSSLPEVRRKAALSRQMRKKDREIMDAAREAGNLCQTLERILNRGEQALNRFKEQRSEAERGLKKGLRTIKEDLREITDAGERVKDTLRRNELSEKQSALKNMQSSFLEDALRGKTLADAHIPGIGQTNKADLARCGVTSAADIARIHILPRRGCTCKTVYIEVRGRGRVRVRGIGPRRAAALIQWRANEIAALKRSVPQALPGSAASEITLRYQGKQEAVAQKVSRARSNARRQEDLARARYRKEEESAVEKLKNLVGHYDGVAGPAGDYLKRAEKRLAELKWQREGLKLEMEAYRHIRFLGYIRRVSLAFLPWTRGWSG